MASQDYPRPDFERTKLNWKSLNGPWDFIFDDQDIGLEENWHRNGLPIAAHLVRLFLLNLSLDATKLVFEWQSF